LRARRRITFATSGSRARKRKSNRRLRTDRTQCRIRRRGNQTTARRDGETYVIDGRKRFISNAGIADFYTVFAKTGTREDGRPELSAFVVGSKMQGFRVVERTQ
jgi:alkylation response protein AidB-like acyl-CoA dehydrogenase